MNTIAFPGLSLGPFTIDPVATPPGSKLEIRWYGIMIMLGMILGVIYVIWRASQNHIKSDDLLDFVIFAVPVGIICARLYYVVFNIKDYQTFRDVIAICGGIIGGFFTMLAVAKFKKMSFPMIVDYFAPGVMIGQMLGRWGNFFNAEAYGDLSKVSFPFIGEIATPIFENNYFLRMNINGDDFHPTFFYESLWLFIGLVLIHFYFKHKKFDGEIFLMYASWYGFGRFFIEGLRTDSLTQGSFRVSQMLALLCVVTGVTLIILGRRKANKKSLALDGYVSQFSEPDEKKESVGETQQSEDKIEENTENKNEKTEGEENNGNNN